ncbi:hypothetical protein [uncultured Roseovarius sp.]|uniref:hypothetical protein n=1 Tax=uncultured Roseovarius sp. TaxID=293344 RepID=UPI0026144D73|nr:hypothetical protein [uncultured Roseovarius sp.]
MKTIFAHKTPGTNLTWYTLEGWVKAANELDQRRSSSARHKALEAHARALTRSVINGASRLETIEHALALLKWGPGSLRRPQKGHRQGAPQTALIEDLMNRKRELERDCDIPSGENWERMHPTSRVS